ncbi:MAG: glycoside hydrolase family 5 protein [Bacteroidales bacterium]|nr:glycoside hydrolase family 5 protein [Bacteroidales bacterium]
MTKRLIISLAGMALAAIAHAANYDLGISDSDVNIGWGATYSSPSISYTSSSWGAVYWEIPSTITTSDYQTVTIELASAPTAALKLYLYTTSTWSNLSDAEVIVDAGTTTISLTLDSSWSFDRIYLQDCTGSGQSVTLSAAYLVPNDDDSGEVAGTSNYCLDLTSVGSHDWSGYSYSNPTITFSNAWGACSFDLPSGVSLSDYVSVEVKFTSTNGLQLFAGSGWSMLGDAVSATSSKTSLTLTITDAMSTADAIWIQNTGTEGATVTLTSICLIAEEDDDEDDTTDTFETATSAVKNMAIGWNAGNRLECNSNLQSNMWIESSNSDYETAWGQKKLSKALITMLKDAGFNTVRIPVTWYPHLGITISSGKWNKSSWAPSSVTIDATWLARVKEVVDYVIDNDMYCILNVHHDTGALSSSFDVAWVVADATYYSKYSATFKSLWTQIATAFKDYGEKLLFEGYNEMMDADGSWNYASSAASTYSSSNATKSYTAVNNFAQDFVDAVRATGGNNSQRNLIVNTYGAACGPGASAWSDYQYLPLTQLTIPTDEATDHLAAEVHCYPYFASGATASDVKTEIAGYVANWKQYILQAKSVPLIIGEWNGSSVADTSLVPTVASELVSQCKDEDIATLLWMSIFNGDYGDESNLSWGDSDAVALKDAIIKAYYGEDGYNTISSGIENVTVPFETDAPVFNLQGIRVERPTTPGIYIQGGKKFLYRGQ